MNLYELELDILAKTNPECGILNVREQVSSLIGKFMDSGQSGGSAPYTAHSIYHEILKSVKNDVLVEMKKDEDSLSFDFTKEINSLCEGIRLHRLENDVDLIAEQIKKLCLFEPISHVTGSDEEWGDVMDFGDGESWYQNRRCSALFKDGKNGKPYYIDAIIKRDQNGTCWSGMAWLSEEDYKTDDRSKMVGKRAYIKSFPFVPKTFYIDVRDVEVAKDDWESFVVEPSQLIGVWEYYDKD